MAEFKTTLNLISYIMNSSPACKYMYVYVNFFCNDCPGSFLLWCSNFRPPDRIDTKHSSKLSALSCGHRQDIPLIIKGFRMFRKRSWSLQRCGQLRECLGNLPKSKRTVQKTLDANDDRTRNWLGSCRESPGSRGSHAEAMQKPRRSHGAMRKPCASHGEDFRKVPNRCSW